MGLGPPVCEKCKVTVYYSHNPDPYGSRWICKYCGNKRPQWNAWDCGLTEEELDNNERFLNFVTGKE